jgi:hypothetical protein
MEMESNIIAQFFLENIRFCAGISIDHAFPKGYLQTGSKFIPGIDQSAIQVLPLERLAPKASKYIHH